MALRPRRGTWARAAAVHTPVEAARALAWGGPGDPGDWTAVVRTFRDGHAETWQAADATLGGWGRTAAGARWPLPPTRAAWSNAPPPPQLQALISSVAAGCGLHLYILN